MNIDINPKILIWAREERGMLTKDVAEKLKIQVSDLANWENNGKAIPFTMLELISKLYKRQTAVFFLSSVPEKIKKPKDCRNLAGRIGKFSVETMLAMRRTERYLEVARELLDPLYWTKQYEWTKIFTSKQDDNKKDISNLREMLDLQNYGGLKYQKSDEAFRNWRLKIEEKLGIFVFQFSMPEDEIDGFSYAFDKFPYAIVVNNHNSPVRKIFTIFHELFHILKHNPCACNTDFSDNKRQLNIELECNKFAGSFLVPRENLKKAVSIEEIFSLAKLSNVSGETYLRRMHDEQLISPSKFFELLDLVKTRSSNFIRHKSKGAPSMFIQSKSTRGNKFFGIVTSAAATNQISYSSASDLLGLKASKFQS